MAVSAAVTQVQNSLHNVQVDQQDIASHKGDAGYLSAHISQYQNDFKDFQKLSSGLQNSSNGSDIQEAQSDEAAASDSFDLAQADLKSALGTPEAQAGLANNDPTLTQLQSGTQSYIDEGNANVLHLQAINNNIDSINSATGIGIGVMTTATTGGDANGPRNTQYGSGTDPNGTPFGVVSGGTASPDQVAADAAGIRQGAGQDKATTFGFTDA